MLRMLKIGRWLGAAGLAFQLGCVTNQQLADFVRTEIARVVAEVFRGVLSIATTAM